MEHTLDPAWRTQTLCFLGGFITVTLGFCVLLAGYVSGRDMLFYAGAGVICSAPVVQLILLVFQSRFWQDRPGTAAGEPFVPGPVVLYEDPLVTITGEGIRFAMYSIPFGEDRTVAFADIDHIEVYEPSLTNGKWRIWGSGDLRTWFPLDIHRSSRDRIFIATLKSGYARVGFTVEDSSRVIALLERQGIPPRGSADAAPPPGGLR